MHGFKRCSHLFHDMQEVSQPLKQPEVPPARFGFNDNAERINSRACMVRLQDHRCTVLMANF